MCGRFINLNTSNFLKKKFEIKNNENIEINISYNISPTQNCSILFNDESSKVENAIWGLKFIDKKTNLEKNIINSRFETIQKKLLFKDSYEKRKCVIPVNGYYEWHNSNNKKTPYFINFYKNHPFFFAGIWKYINFKINTNKFFSIITKKSNSFLQKIHHRMPVILNLDEAIQYLNDGKSEFLKNNFISQIEENISFFEVSKFVNNPINNSIECIKKIN